MVFPAMKNGHIGSFPKGHMEYTIHLSGYGLLYQIGQDRSFSRYQYQQGHFFYVEEHHLQI